MSGLRHVSTFMQQVILRLVEHNHEVLTGEAAARAEEYSRSVLRSHAACPGLWEDDPAMRDTLKSCAAFLRERTPD